MDAWRAGSGDASWARGIWLTPRRASIEAAREAPKPLLDKDMGDSQKLLLLLISLGFSS